MISMMGMIDHSHHNNQMNHSSVIPGKVKNKSLDILCHDPFFQNNFSPDDELTKTIRPTIMLFENSVKRQF
jgi:hypothetical protein